MSSSQSLDEPGVDFLHLAIIHIFSVPYEFLLTQRDRSGCTVLDHYPGGSFFIRLHQVRTSGEGGHFRVLDGHYHLGSRNRFGATLGSQLHFANLGREWSKGRDGLDLEYPIAPDALALPLEGPLGGAVRELVRADKVDPQDQGFIQTLDNKDRVGDSLLANGTFYVILSHDL